MALALEFTFPAPEHGIKHRWRLVAGEQLLWLSEQVPPALSQFSSLGPWPPQNPLSRALFPEFILQPLGTLGYASWSASTGICTFSYQARWGLHRTMIFIPTVMSIVGLTWRTTDTPTPGVHPWTLALQITALVSSTLFWPVLSFSMTPKWHKFISYRWWERMNTPVKVSRRERAGRFITIK